MRYAGCRCSRAHPHSCGENGTLAVQDLCATGSSPLTRGKPGRVHGVTESLGLIPAHAGKTGTGTGSVVTRGAHPHSCGENLIGVTADLSAQGSSPLVRGKHFLTYAFVAQIGQTLESPELCVSSESYSSREPVPPATSRNATAESRARSSAPHSLQPTRWSIRFQKERTPPSE